MILNIVIIIFLVCLIAVIVNHSGIDRVSVPDCISIKESMDLCSLPVITFMNNNTKFNFLLDTGAQVNHVGSKAMDNMIGTDSERSVEVQGFAGKDKTSGGKYVDLIYKDRVFTTEVFVSAALDDTFAEIKKNLGVQIHGIIGNIFMRENGYVLDFYDLIAYSKK